MSKKKKRCKILEGISHGTKKYQKIEKLQNFTESKTATKTTQKNTKTTNPSKQNQKIKNQIFSSRVINT